MYSEVPKEEMKPKREAHLFHRRKKRLLSPAGNGFEKFLDLFVLFSFCFILLGMIGAISSFSTTVLKNFFGLLLIGYSGIHFYFFQHRMQLSFYKLSGLFSIISFLLGISCVFISSENYLSILVLFGVYSLLVAVERILQGFSLVRLRDKSVIVFIVHIILLVFMAILLFLNPFVNLHFGEVLSVFEILFGVLNLSSLSFMRKKEESILSFLDS